MPPVALPVKLTVRGACPEVGEADAVAVRDDVEVTVMLRDLLLVALTLSVTVRVAV